MGVWIDREMGWIFGWMVGSMDSGVLFGCVCIQRQIGWIFGWMVGSMDGIGVIGERDRSL
jgi:hypothetical protein